jgi:hypothetical protein
MCRPRSAVALPSRTGGGQNSKAATNAAPDALRSRETSTPRVIRALQLLSPAELAEGSAARGHRVPPPARLDRARQARHVPSALCSRSPQPSWLRAAPHSSIECRRRRAAITQDDHVTRCPRSAPAELAEGRASRQHHDHAAACASRSCESSTPHVVRAPQSLSPAELAEGSAIRQHRVLPQARRNHARRSRHAPSALCSRSPLSHWRWAAPPGSTERSRRRFAIARDEHATCRPRSAVALPRLGRAGEGPSDSDPPATPTDGDWADPPDWGAAPASADSCGGRYGSRGQRRPAERRARQATPPPPPSRDAVEPAGRPGSGGQPPGFSPLAGRLRQGLDRAPPRWPPPHTHACDACALRSRPVSPYAPRGTAIAAVPLAQRSSIRYAACQID